MLKLPLNTEQKKGIMGDLYPSHPILLL